jgi:aconitate hydratase
MIEKPLPEEKAKEVKIHRASSIVVPPVPDFLPKDFKGVVTIKVGDKITTDHIMPAGAFLKLRSNVPEYAKVVFNSFNQPGKPTFAQRALELKGKGFCSVIVAGQSYGQGSSREHAALCPMYLGVRVVIAKSIERIHRANLINFCIVPVEFAEPADYEKINEGDRLEISNLTQAIEKGGPVTIVDKGSGPVRVGLRHFEFEGRLDLTEREKKILLSAGLLQFTRNTVARS